MVSYIILPIIMLLFSNNISTEGSNILKAELASDTNHFTSLLIEIMVNTLRPYKCVAIITDPIYRDVFQDVLFQKFGIYLSFFTIYVSEFEDLIAPNRRIREALIRTKDHGCQIYIIFVANGFQVARLLRYGDRYRVLDTRAKFILLYDLRLFNKHLHYLWKRIVNVIFVREYGGIKRQKGSYTAMPWFEISTVPFPSPIQSVFVPRRLDIWAKSKFRSGTDLFRDKTRDLKNQTMKVVAFKHTPATTKISFPEEATVRTILGNANGPMGFAGLEVEILDTVSKEMNFKCDLYELPNTEAHFWGKRLSGGQFSGLFGEMISSRADIALGDLYYIPSILNLMDLTVPYNTECLTFLTPESLTDNSWKTLILPFKAVMWLCVILCLFVSGIILHYLALFHRRVTEQPKRQRMARTRRSSLARPAKKKQILSLPLGTIDQLDPHSKYILMREQFVEKRGEDDPIGLYLFADFFNSILYAYSMLLMVSLPKLPTGWSLRVLTGWYWLYCTLVAVSYRASMTAILANPAPRVTIDTLQELVDSKLQLGGLGDINRQFFRSSLDPASQEIGAKFAVLNDTREAIDRVAAGKFAFYENIHFLKEATVNRQLEIQNSAANVSKRRFAGGTENRNLHIMSDCLINMPISIGLQKNSPIKPRVDKYIRRVLEAGLLKKWLDDVMQPTLNAEIPMTLQTTKALMNMQKFIGAIVALCIGYFISFVALAIELCYFHFIVKKHPNYNKYSKRVYHDNIMVYYKEKIKLPKIKRKFKNKV